jgi:RNA polymerase sigma factor (sigma-70 family)
MNGLRPDVVLRHIRELADTPDRLDDRQLLRRFAATRDEAAFAALLRRHGSLVLGVCRRVLGNLHDAEDAFQATFLTLARQAATAGRRAALGTWLYRVAYRTALRARRQSAARRRREQSAPPRGESDPLAEVTGRELMSVLDAELYALPEQLRAPLVLCYLEGKARDEAARELGWSLGTLKRRLAQGRTALRARIAGRGISPAALLAAGIGGAVVSASLAEATTTAARLVASGQANALPVGVALLLRGATAARRKLIGLAAVLVTLAAASAGVFAYRSPPAKEEPPPGRAEAPRPREEPLPVKPDPDGSKKMTVKGRVLDAVGKPLPDAEVVICTREGLVMSTGEWWAAYRNDVLGRVKTDENGLYRLSVPKSDPHINIRSLRVVVTAPGHGLDWKALKPDAAEADADLRLKPVQRVSGHLTGLQGENAAGVTIHVARVKRKPAMGEPDGDTILSPPDDLPITATTDDKGNFVLDRFGPDMALGLEILDPRYERKTDWEVNTADRKSCENVRLVLAPGRYVEGRVVYQDTGKPVPHAALMLTNPIIEAKADAEGRFKVPLYNPRDDEAFGFISRDVSVCAFPPPGEPYLGAAQGVDFPKGVVRREVNLALTRGALIRGKVTEAVSGKPVEGARIAYNAGYDHSVASGPDGSYQIGAAPGAGRLIVSHPSGEYIAEVLGSAGGVGDKAAGDPAYHHAILDVEVKPGEKVKEVNVSLRRGVTVRGRLVGPDDKPVDSAVLFVSRHRPRFENTMHPLLVRGGRFEVRGLDPKKTYHLVFLEHPRLPRPTITPESLQGFPQLYIQELLGPANKVGMAVEVSPKEVKEDFVVKLAPCGKAKVRFVDGAGKPLANYSAWLQLVVTPGPRIFQALEEKTLAAEVVTLTGRYGGQLDGKPSDANGFATFEGLIPGATYRLKKTDREPNNEVLKDFTAEAGKTTEITVTVK